MGRYVTVSVKVPLELKDKLNELNIKPSSLLRRAIIEEVRRREVERIKEEATRLRPALDRIPMAEVVRSVREMRERR